MQKKYLLLFSLFFYSQLNAQFFKDAHYSTEIGTNLGKGDHTPFWFMSNKHGVSSGELPNGYLRAAVFRPFDLIKPFSYSWGADFVGALNYDRAFNIQQLYFSLKYKPLVFEIGSKERDPELRNPELSSGSLTLSNNARPIPQARIGLPDYLTVPYTKEWFHIKGHLAYGVFVDNDFQQDFTEKYPLNSYPPQGKYVKNAIYHSKALYGKIGNEEIFPLTFEGGLEMVARFGGECFLNDGTHFKAPAKISDFLRILIPLKGGGDSPIMDQQNVLGDHLGSWNFSLNYQYRNWLLRLYYEHQFNDHSQMFGEYSWRDGLWGVEIGLPDNRFINRVVFERIDSRDQSGAIYHDSNEQIPDQISAVDDYYNHGVYSGWQHGGQAIANPLFISPLYNTNYRLQFISNRIVANHIGFSGEPFSCLKYRVLLAFTDHWGTYIQPFNNIKYSYNYLFELIGTHPKKTSWQFVGSFGLDRSNIIGNNWGVSFSLRKTGVLNK